MAAQDLLPVLLRQGLPHTQPGVPERGRCQPDRRQARVERRSENQGLFSNCCFNTPVNCLLKDQFLFLI